MAALYCLHAVCKLVAYSAFTVESNAWKYV